MNFVVDNKSDISDNAHMMVDKSSIADKLHKYRIDRCWTQAQLANRLGVHKTAISKMENNIYQWSDLMLARLLNKLPDLLDGEQSAGSDPVN